MAIGNTGTISTAISALYGLGSSLVLGWAIHLVHGAVLGVVYAAIISSTSYGHHLDDVRNSSLWGLGYGAATAIPLAALLMPLWLAAAGFQGAPGFLNFKQMGLLGHLVYGAVLGASYPLIRSQVE